MSYFELGSLVTSKPSSSLPDKVIVYKSTDEGIITEETVIRKSQKGVEIPSESGKSENVMDFSPEARRELLKAVESIRDEDRINRPLRLTEKDRKSTEKDSKISEDPLVRQPQRGPSSPPFASEKPISEDGRKEDLKAGIFVDNLAYMVQKMREKERKVSDDSPPKENLPKSFLRRPQGAGDSPNSSGDFPFVPDVRYGKTTTPKWEEEGIIDGILERRFGGKGGKAGGNEGKTGVKIGGVLRRPTLENLDNQKSGVEKEEERKVEIGAEVEILGENLVETEEEILAEKDDKFGLWGDFSGMKTKKTSLESSLNKQKDYSAFIRKPKLPIIATPETIQANLVVREDEIPNIREILSNIQEEKPDNIDLGEENWKTIPENEGNIGKLEEISPELKEANESVPPGTQKENFRWEKCPHNCLQKIETIKYSDGLIPSS